jgi:outer membrane protein assembly factor BamB
VIDGILYIGANDSKLYALDADTGQVKWSFYTTPPPPGIDSLSVGTPTVVGGVVYFGAQDTTIYALDALTRKTKWTLQTNGFATWPQIVNGVLYTQVNVNTGNDKLYALDVRTGREKWTFSTGKELSDFALVGGVLYVSSEDHTIDALDGNTGQLKWKFQSDEITKVASLAVVDGILYFFPYSGKIDAFTLPGQWA